ncbi:MAG: putative methyltransferase [Acidobacteria bacterium]|nr:putative methyltransferase [Acidobacteriota bacterium]
MRNRSLAKCSARLVAAGLLAAVALIAQPLAARSPVHSIGQPAQSPARTPDVIFVPTPDTVVQAMLDVANVTSSDVVYDLGCGDGRRGARGVGIDIDPSRIREATANARAAGVTDKVQFMEADLFATDISEATVVTLYLLPSLNRKLMPKLLEELRPGTRIVSHAFDMGDWAPDKHLEVDGRDVYFWTVPKR